MRYPTKTLTEKQLKILAAAMMFLSHFAQRMPMRLQLLQEFLAHLDSFSFIVILFFMAESYMHSPSRKNYFLRMLVFAILSQPVYWKVNSTWKGNLLFNFCIGFLIMYIYDKVDPWVPRLLFPIPLVLLSSICDWSVMGPFVALHMIRYYGRRDYFPYMCGASIMMSAGMHHINKQGMATAEIVRGNLFTAFGILLAFMLLFFYYRGEKGKKEEKLDKALYLFYPLHYILLGFFLPG